jgi:hypothetical protein
MKLSSVLWLAAAGYVGYRIGCMHAYKKVEKAAQKAAEKAAPLTGQPSQDAAL